MVINKCTKCDISIVSEFKPCQPVINGREILFLTDAPTLRENNTKQAFSSRSYKLLKEFIAAYKMEDCTSFTNVIKCRPPRDRSPQLSEIVKCSDHFKAELNFIKPKIIVTVGINALFALTRKPVDSMKDFVNNPFVVGKVIILPIFKPAYITKQGTYKSYIEAFNKLSYMAHRVNKYIDRVTFDDYDSLKDSLK